MKVNLHNVGFTVDQKLVDFIQKKMDKLDLFYDKVIDAEVYLKLDNTTAKENKIVEIKINVPGDSFVVKKQFKSFEEGVDSCVNPIKKKKKKKKDIFFVGGGGENHPPPLNSLFKVVLPPLYHGKEISHNSQTSL